MIDQLDLLDSIPVGACVLRKDGLILFWNRCLEDWTQIPRTRAMGFLIGQLYPHLTLHKYASRLQTIFEGGPPTIFSAQIHKSFFPCHRSDGVAEIQHTTITAIPQSNGEFHALVCIQDVTELTRRIQDYKTIRDQALLEVAERRQTEQILQQKKEELEQYTIELIELNRMSELLQSCRNFTEAHQVISVSLNSLLPGAAGILYRRNRDRQTLEKSAAWGVPIASYDSFTPDQCWGLRRGRSHGYLHPAGVLCDHLTGRCTECCCLPLLAQGEVLGMLLLQTDRAGYLEERKQLLTTVTEQISLALANINLREILQNQSIRDSLTGLFNRRYLQETLEIHLQRARYGSNPISLLLIDADRFKRVNDTYGHPMGDALLQKISRLIQETIRPTDFACRYGGEEFAVVMPGAPQEIAKQRAEMLRQKIRECTLLPDRIIQTVSIGIASFPHHGDTLEHLIQAADKALYLAKTGGRDRVMVSDKLLTVLEKSLEIAPEREERCNHHLDGLENEQTAWLRAAQIPTDL